jgi:hypothetical protein
VLRRRMHEQRAISLVETGTVLMIGTVKGQATQGTKDVFLTILMFWQCCPGADNRECMQNQSCTNQKLNITKQKMNETVPWERTGNTAPFSGKKKYMAYNLKGMVGTAKNSKN